jgi:hypothetical protein
MNLTFQQNDGSWTAVRRISAFVRLAFLCLVSAHLASKVIDRTFSIREKLWKFQRKLRLQ